MLAVTLFLAVLFLSIVKLRDAEEYLEQNASFAQAAWVPKIMWTTLMLCSLMAALHFYVR